MSKFKVGDIVVCTKHLSGIYSVVTGRAYPIESIITPSAANNYWGNKSYTIGLRTSEASVSQVSPDMIEHESIYNSPLYKALR